VIGWQPTQVQAGSLCSPEKEPETPNPGKVRSFNTVFGFDY
jgi:hypothetical protein